MLAKDLISDIISPLHTSDTAQKALSWMEIYKVSHLPIVNDKKFLGLISESDIYDLNDPELPIGAHKLNLFSPFVYEDDHIFTVISLVANMKLTLIPVLDREDNYVGSISLQDIIKYFSKLISSENPGAIIVLEVSVHDYQLSQIAQIVEGNNAKILTLYIDNNPDSSRMNVIIKVNVTEITSIIRTFERYDYTIKATFSEETELNELYKNRYDLFMRLLNM
jgi:acetoin utilization protein AcuB